MSDGSGIWPGAMSRDSRSTHSRLPGCSTRVLPSLAFQRMRAVSGDKDAEDPYSVLGIAHDADDAEVKKIYRTLIREHHPDRLIAEGLPEEFVAAATAKMAAINAAYDRIAKQRGMN